MVCAVTVRNHSERTLLGMFAVLQNGLTADQMQQATCKYTTSISAEINNAPNTKLRLEPCASKGAARFLGSWTRTTASS